MLPDEALKGPVEPLPANEQEEEEEPQHHVVEVDPSVLPPLSAMLNIYDFAVGAVVWWWMVGGCLWMTAVNMP